MTDPTNNMDIIADMANIIGESYEEGRRMESPDVAYEQCKYYSPRESVGECELEDGYCIAEFGCKCDNWERDYHGLCECCQSMPPLYDGLCKECCEKQLGGPR